MKDLERILQSGKDTPTPDGLTERLEQSIDRALDGAASSGATAASASTSVSTVVPASAWATGIAIVGLIVAWIGFSQWTGGSNETIDPDASNSVAWESDDASSDEDDASSAAESFNDNPSTSDVTSDNSETTETDGDTTVVVTDEEIVVFGTVRDVAGNPVPLAQVSVRPTSSQRRYWGRRVTSDSISAVVVTADENGDYEARLTRRSSPRSDEFVHEFGDTIARIDETLDLSLQEQDRRVAVLSDTLAQLQFTRDQIADEREVAGQVVMDLSRLRATEEMMKLEEEYVQAQVAAEVAAKDAAMQWSHDARGLVGFEAPTAAASTRQLEISATLAGYQPSDLIEIDIPETSTRVDLVLETAELLSGLVLDGSGVPMVDATVRIVASLTGSPLPGPAISATTDESGRFLFNQLPPGSYLLQAASAGVETASVWADTGGDDVTLEVARAGEVRLFLLTEEDEPIEHASVEWYQEGHQIFEGNSDQNGVSFFQSVPAGEYLVRIKVGSQVYPSYEEYIVIDPGPQEFTVVPQGRVNLDGHLNVPEDLLNDEGMINSGEFLIAAYKDSVELPSTRGSYAPVDADGSFTLNNLPPGGYTVAIARRLKSSMIIRSFQPMRISDGPAVQRAELTYIDTPLATLVVQATDGDGNPISGGEVTFVRSRTGGQSSHNLNKSGEYTIQLHPDPFELTISARGFEPQRVPVRLIAGAERTVSVTLKPKTTLDEALERILPEGAELTLHRAITARALLEYIDTLRPGTIRLSGLLRESSALDQLSVGSAGTQPLFQLMRAVVFNGDLDYQFSTGRLQLDFEE